MLKNKFETLYILLIAALIVLSGCGDTVVPTVSDGIGSEVSADFASSAEDSSEESRPEVQLNADEESILALVEADTEIAKLIVSGDIYSKEWINGYEYIPLETDSPYHSFSALETLISDTYSAESGIYGLYFSYPTQSGPTVKNIDGVTNVCLAYAPEITVIPDISTAEFTSLTAYGASLNVTCSDGKKYAFNAVREDGNWRLENSLFFMSKALQSDTSWDSSDLEHGQNEGSAKSLTGNCLVVNVFIDDRVSSWSDDEVESVLHYMDDSVLFLENEAARYGAELDLYSTDKEHSVYLKTSRNITTSLEEYLWIELLFADTTYRTLEGCVKSYFNLESYDNWCVMLHIDKNGRSYALPCNSDYYDHEIYYSERAVMYYSADTSYEYYSVAGTYAHEMLHLFGANDLYDTNVTDDTVKLLEHFFPNEIMRVVYNDLGTQAISPYTAYRVGWIGELTEPFESIETN